MIWIMIKRLIKRLVRSKEISIFFKQFGKAICYFSLFFGMQIAIFMVYEIFYVMKEAVLLAVSGQPYNPQAVMEGATKFMLKNTNVVSILSGCITIFVLWIFFLIRKKKLVTETNITKLQGKYIPFIIPLGITFATTISFGLNLLPENMLEAYGENVQLAMGGSTLLMVLSNMIMAPIVEEIIFRGLILSRLRKAMPLVWAVLLSSLIFGVAHGQIVWMAYAFILGIILAVVAVKTNSILASILLHMVFNICGTVVPTIFSDITSTALITVITITAGAASAFLLFIILRRKREGKNLLQTV